MVDCSRVAAKALLVHRSGGHVQMDGPRQKGQRGVSGQVKARVEALHAHLLAGPLLHEVRAALSYRHSRVRRLDRLLLPVVHMVHVAPETTG